AAVIGLRREPDNGCGAAVKIPVGNDDFGAIARNAFATVPPATGGFDRSLHRFGTRIHRQRGIKAGAPTQICEKRSEPIIVVGARWYCEPAGLRCERRKDPWMAMAVTGGGIGTHHVDVAPPFDVP